MPSGQPPALPYSASSVPLRRYSPKGSRRFAIHSKASSGPKVRLQSAEFECIRYLKHIYPFTADSALRRYISQVCSPVVSRLRGSEARSKPGLNFSDHCDHRNDYTGVCGCCNSQTPGPCRAQCQSPLFCSVYGPLSWHQHHATKCPPLSLTSITRDNFFFQSDIWLESLPGAADRGAAELSSE